MNEQNDSFPEKLAIIAGEGDAPFIAIEEALENKVDVTIFAFNRITSRKTCSLVPKDKVHWFRFGQFEALFTKLKSLEIKNVIFLGRISHHLVFLHGALDEWSRQQLRTLSNKDAKSIKNVIFNILQGYGLTVEKTSLYLRKCIPAAGLLTKNRPITDDEEKSIKFGFKKARLMAELEIGQTIAVSDGVVIAVEAIEGTNQLIKRAGKLRKSGGVIIKASRPEQDPRFDLPVIGKTTIDKVRKAKFTALALTAGETIFLDQEATIKFAEKYNIGIISVNPKEYE